MHCNTVTALNTRACKNREFRYTALKQIASFVEDEHLNYLQLVCNKMVDRGSRAASAPNFLTRKGISYHPDGCEQSALEVPIQDYFNNEVVTIALMKVTTTMKV